MKAESEETQKLHISFIPESEEFSMATQEYENIWRENGERIIKTIKEVSGLNRGGQARSGFWQTAWPDRGQPPLVRENESERL